MAQPSAHVIDALVRKLDTIASLSDDERQAVERLPVTLRELRRDQDFVRDGDRPSHCCVLIEGWACRYKIIADGKRQILSFHVPGEIPDLHSLFLPVMDHALGTLTEAKVAFIPHDNIRDLVSRHPGVAATLWRETLVDAAIFREWITGMGRRSAPQRLAHLFCEMYVRQEAVGLAGDLRCPMPVKQMDLGDALGLSTVHVNRSLQELRADGLLALKGGTLTIEDWSRLRASCGFDPTYLHLKGGPARA